MADEVAYLYRGTTEGWPGNDVLQQEGITCTTTDPLVATLFAIESRNHGPAIIQAAPRGLFEELIGPENFFAAIESAVNVLVPPAEFTRRVVVSLEVDQALEILREIGLDRIPTRIRDRVALQAALEESHTAAQRLNLDQIRLFNLRMLGGKI